MNKKLATFISGIICSKGVELKSPPNRIIPQEAIVIDFGLDLAAKESRNPAKQRQAQPEDLQANQPARIAQLGARWSARTDKQPVYNQNLPG